MSNRSMGKPLWVVRQHDGTDSHLYPGTLSEVMAYVREKHRETGRQYKVRGLGQ